MTCLSGKLKSGFKFGRANGDKEEISWEIKNSGFLNKHLNTQKYCGEKVQTANCDIKQMNMSKASNEVGTANCTALLS